METTLVSSPDSYDSFVLRWMCYEKEAVVQHKLLRQVNSALPLPYLLDQDLQLFDHNVVVQYLQERYPGEPLLPQDPRVRAQIRQICVLLREAKGDIVPDLTYMLGRSTYLIGEFSMADIYAGADLRQRWQDGELQLPASVAVYWERLRARPAFKKANNHG